MSRKSKKKSPEKKFNVDFNKKYLIDMLPNGVKDRKVENCKKVSCNINLLDDGYTIRATCDGFQNAYFYIEFFDWLLYNNTLKVDESV